MREYLTHWQFWASVVIVALIVNFVWGRYMGGKGQAI